MIYFTCFYKVRSWISCHIICSRFPDICCQQICLSRTTAAQTTFVVCLHRKKKNTEEAVSAFTTLYLASQSFHSQPRLFIHKPKIKWNKTTDPRSLVQKKAGGDAKRGFATIQRRTRTVEAWRPKNHSKLSVLHSVRTYICYMQARLKNIQLAFVVDSKFFAKPLPKWCARTANIAARSVMSERIGRQASGARACWKDLSSAK